MTTFRLRIVASDKVFYDGKAVMVILPAIDGERGIMAHHEDMIIAVDVGELRYQTDDEQWHKAIVGGGFAQIANNRAQVLVDSAERPEDIDEKRAAEALERAKEQLRQKQSMREYKMSQASLARALSRLKEKGKNNINAGE